MAVVLYSNGITELYKPNNLVFTEEEIAKLFQEFKELRTIRLISVINTWCVFGIGNNDPDEFNRLASDIVKEQVYSPILFIHDSELNPEWHLTDSIIYKSYNDFLKDIKKLIDDVALLIMNQINPETYDNANKVLPQLTPIGSTKDKKIIFEFNPEDQAENFYKNEEFYMFSQKVYDYLIKNKQKKGSFVIYSDKKAMIIIEPKKVKTFLNTLIKQFQEKEDYEICVNITKIMKEWLNDMVPVKVSKPRGRPRKTNPSNNTTNEQ